MPVLSNHKHELFCQNIAIGMGVAEAYVAAGYKPNPGNASALKSQQNILTRLDELLNASAAKVISKVEYTRDHLLDRLEEVRRVALDAGQTSAAVQAIMGQAKIVGAIIDRREVAGPGEFDHMTDAELIEKAARDARELGLTAPTEH